MRNNFIHLHCWPDERRTNARARNCHIRLGLLSRSPPLYLNLALQWRHLGKMACLGSMGCRPRSWELLGFLSSPHCGELVEPIRSHERHPQPFDPQVRLLSVSAGTSLQGAARNPRANPHEHSISLGKGWSSGGCSALVSCMRPESKIRTPQPISEFPSATDKSASSPGRLLDQRGADRPRGCTNVIATYGAEVRCIVH